MKTNRFHDYLGLSNSCSYDVDDVIGRVDRFGFQNFCSPGRMFVYFYVLNSKTLLRLQRYSPGLKCSTPRLQTTFYTMLYTMPSSLVLIFFLTTRHKVRLLKLHDSVCMFAIFAFNLTVQFRRYIWNLVRIGFMASEEVSFENVDLWRRTDGQQMPASTISSLE